MTRLRAFAWAVTVLVGTTLLAQETRPREMPLPPGARVERDVEYVRNGVPAQRLDVYMPQRSTEPRPCIVFIHGGGWQAGDKERCPAVPLVMRGYVVVSINYRLTGEANFPAQIDDCREAVRFLRKNADRFGIDPKRVAAWGGSAGAHLAALLGTDPAEGAEVQAVIDAFGPADLRNIVQQASSRPATRGPVEALLGGSADERPDVARAASPVAHVTPDDPPILILHGTADPIVPVEQSDALAAKLKEAGVDVTLIRLDGAGHGGREFAAPEVRQAETSFLEKHLKPRATTDAPGAKTR